MPVMPETDPPLKVKWSIPSPVVAGFPVLTSNDASPLAAVGLTPMFTGTAVPCFTFTGLPEFNCNVVDDEVKVTLFQLFTRLVASTDPKPVARS